ncbi:MAG: hypothetical protein ACI9MC_004046 [Kiritimatiellia bacterium]
MRTVPVLILLAACTSGSDAPQGDRYIAPLDGQTAVPTDARLIVVAEDMSLPPDYPLLELFRVVDMDEGGRVEGSVKRFTDFFEFIPNSQWDADRRYGWVIDVPPPVPHGPHLTFPDILGEPSTFETSSRINVLGGSVDLDDRVCVVMSRLLRAADKGDWRLSLNDEHIDDVVGSLLPRGEWGPDLDFVANDQGVDVMCLDFPQDDTDQSPTSPSPVVAGDHVRLWWGDEGPWLIELQDGPVIDVVTQLRRGVR